MPISTIVSSATSTPQGLRAPLLRPHQNFRARAASARLSPQTHPQTRAVSTQTQTVFTEPDEREVQKLVAVETPVEPVLVAPATAAAPTAAAPTSVCSSKLSHSKDHNSVTVKEDTSVKDAAGAVVKVLHRIFNTFITSLRNQNSNESLNRTVKAIAVARKYIKDEDSSYELSFLPFNRSDSSGIVQPNLFAFLAFKTVVDVALKEYDETDLNVSKNSDPNAMANAIICIVKERGQAVMKAGGNDAIFVAMSAVANARRRLKRNHEMDVMLIPSWITEDTTATLGRVSKFLKFNVLPCPVNGPLDRTVHPSQSAEDDHHPRRSHQQGALAFA